MGMRPFMESTPTRASVTVLPDAESLAVAAAGAVLAEARRAVRERGRFTIALAGGATPEPVYRLLAAPPFSELMPWRQTEVFWGDERCVDPADARSNEGVARKALLDHVPVAPERVHPMRCADGEAAAERAAADYEALLRSLFAPGDGIDVVLLGVGANGHTASLFPGSPALDEPERWAMAALEDPETSAATSGAGERLWRVTLTAPFINRAALILFVVAGHSKAAAVEAAVAGRGDPHELPVLLIRPEPGRLVWLLDEAAGAGLRHDGPAR